VCSCETNSKITGNIKGGCSRIGLSYFPADRRAEDNLVQFSGPRDDSMQGDTGSLQCDQDTCGKKAAFRSFCLSTSIVTWPKRV